MEEASARGPAAAIVLLWAINSTVDRCVPRSLCDVTDILRYFCGGAPARGVILKAMHCIR